MLDPGSQVGRYEIHRKLGRGGMGAVYVAHDPVLGRMVAIKVFSGDLDFPEARERFSREARSAAALNHPNIVTVYDFGEFESQPYIVMEYVPGETLAQLIRRKAPAELDDKLRWMEELCTGAGYAHQMQVIHRDIKPSNLIVDRSGRLKILDFGIARVMGIASNTTAMVGTPGYMSPEQIQGGAVDLRADLFSIGVVFYELLAYAEAFPGDTMASITHRVVTADPVPLSQKAPDAPPDAVAVVEQLLKKNPAERFTDAEAVKGEIGRIRRRLESESEQIGAPTILRPARDVRDTTPMPEPQATPVPGRRTTAAGRTPKPDREALARRREEQLRAALDVARRSLADGDLEGAYDACQQALTFDEQHLEALELEAAIQAAYDARDASSSAADAVDAVTRRPPGPDDDVGPDAFASPSPSTPVPPAFAPMEPEGMPAGLPIDRTILVPAGAPRAGHAAHAELTGVAVTDVGATVLVPRRTPAPTHDAPVAPPPSRPAAPAVAPAAPPLVAEKTAPSPVARPIPKKAPVVAKPRQPNPIVIRVRTLAAEAAKSWQRASQRQRRIGIGAAAGVALVAVAVTAFVLMPARPVPTGTLIVDAVPWGTVTSIQSESGQRLTLPPQAATPLSLALPPGNYEIVVTGPPPESQTQQLTVRVDSEATAVPAAIKFRVVTPEDYFEQYLASSVVPAPATVESTTPPSSAPSASPSPTGVNP